MHEQSLQNNLVIQDTELNPFLKVHLLFQLLKAKFNMG